jgi:hypothetical protein
VTKPKALLFVAALTVAAGDAFAQQPSAWDKMPHMQLERQYAGPLQDTIVQRWRDPVDGTICYIYLPISAEHSPPTPAGFVQYGANTIGSISCLVGRPAPTNGNAPTAAPPRAARP